MTAEPPRRPLKSRDTSWARGLASVLVRARIHPNTISLFSIVFGAAAGVAFASVPHVSLGKQAGLLVLSALCIQLRLLCNLMDGMVAIEGGMKTKSGEVYNDAPDRLADVFILVGAGYALTWPSWAHELGWLAGLLAVLTAYVRLLGGAGGLTQDFCGPMAKPHRMATMTVASLLAALEPFAGSDRHLALLAGLVVVALGSSVTAIRRLMRVVAGLEARAAAGPPRP